MALRALPLAARFGHAARFTLAALLLGTSLLISACGDSSFNTTGTSGNTVQPTPTPTPTPTPSNYTLSVSIGGSGTVTSSPTGINCGTSCSASYASGTNVTLTASAASGYTFAGWSGACSGTGASCTVAMTAARSVTATFSQTISNTASLAWDPVVATNFSGYRIYYGTAPGTYQQTYGQGISVGNVTTYTLTGLSNGTRYYFAVTSVDTSGNESVYSNEAFKDIP